MIQLSDAEYAALVKAANRRRQEPCPKCSGKGDTVKWKGEYRRFECSQCCFRWSIGARQRGRKKGDANE